MKIDQWSVFNRREQGHLKKPLSAIEIDPKQDWRKKHFKSIELNYRKSSEFSKCLPELQHLFSIDEQLLADLCYQHLLFWLKKFSILTPIVRASELQVSGQKSELVLALCRLLNATEYISGPMGKDYLQTEDFVAANIVVSYQKYDHPIYPQLYGKFLPAMAAIDAWLNCPDVSNLIQRK